MPDTATAQMDLAERWRRARNAALRTVAPEGTAEDALLAAALAADAPAAERRVFDNSLRLGRGFARYFDTEVTLAELPELLSRMGLPCLQGCFRAAGDEPAIVLERAGCAGEHGKEACSYFREAILGLVLGVTGGIQHARHESLGHGGGRCVDVFHLDPESPLRFGPIPADVQGVLDGVQRTARAFDSSADLRFLGLSENVLFYRVEQRPGSARLQSIIERGVRRKLPDLEIREVSPRPVPFGES